MMLTPEEKEENLDLKENFHILEVCNNLDWFDFDWKGALLLQK